MTDLIERLKAAGETSCLDRTSPFTTNNSATLHCEAASEVERLRAALTEVQLCLEGEPEFHSEGLGCGVEDRGLTSRYDAAEYGWGAAIDRVYSEHINGAREVLSAALQEDKTDG